jgi:chromosome segregation protein
MRLSHLEIVGFKSFSSKLKVKFSDGITAVVGPNGCGKSNIVDAIRWVLGEHRATSLRGNRMEDIIFSGTALRKPLGMAEVSLTIDNQDQKLPIEYSEVTLTRRYFRSGDSEYFINKVRCRLRDITDLLLDTGMGAHAYSIIEQGMVDSIVNGSPMERRQLIEEAAGINKYKTRRRLAQRKLEGTEHDLVRIADLLEEVERTSGSLRRQVWKYDRHQRLTQDIQDIEVVIAYHNFMTFRQQAEPVRAKISELTKQKEMLSTRIRTVEANIEKQHLEMTEKERMLQERHALFNEVDSGIRTLNEQVLVNRERRSGLEHRVKIAEEDIERSQAELRQINDQQKRAQNDQQGVVEALEQTRTLFQERDKEAHAFAGQVTHLKESTRVLQSRRYMLIQQQTEKQAEIKALESRIDGLRNRQYDVGKTHEKIAGDLVDVDKNLKAAKKELHRAVLQVNESTKLKTSTDQDLQAKQQRREAGRERQSALATQLATREREHGLLVQMQQQYAGYEQGVKALMTDGPSIQGLRGTLAEQITVDKRYATVIEAQMGDILQYVVSESMDDAQQGIRYLRDNKVGTVSFLLLDRIIDQPGSVTDLPADDKGIIGRATDYVKTDKALAPALAYLLSHTVLVQDIETAFRLVPFFNDGQGWQLLTLAGEQIDPVGILTGGTGVEEDTSLLSRANRIETIETELNTLREEHRVLTEDLVTLATDLNVLIERRTMTDRALSEQQQSHMRIEQNVRQHEFQHEQLGDRERSLAQEAKTLTLQSDEAVTHLKEMRDEGVRSARSCEMAEAAAQEAQEELDQLEADGQRFSNAAHEARVALISLESRGNELRTTSTHLTQQDERLNTVLTQRREEIVQGTTLAAELNKVLEQGEEELKALYTNRREKELARDAVMEEHRAIQENVRSLQQDGQEGRNALSQIQEQIHQAELEDTELDMKGHQIRSLLIDQYETDPENITELPNIPGLETFDAETAQAIRHDLQRKLDELGPINMAAVEEYNVAKERVDFLKQQQDDLIGAKENLEKTIVKMNRAARARFLDTFEEIRHHFTKTFQALFEGGEADLKLEEGDPLEAGIEIMARPSGKRLQSIALLSGGETALTAIALLFAIYLVKPSPFCVFDEVDAPLDDANVRRFAAALHQFSQETQFLVVTHNKRTMEAADFLYGITMEEPGMSKMVSVRLEGAQEEIKTPEPVESSDTNPVEVQ